MSTMDKRSLSGLVADSIADLTKLWRTEVDLALAEASERLAMVAGSARLIAVGLVMLTAAMVLILFAVATGLIQLGLSPSLGYLCSGLGAALLAYLVLRAGFVGLVGRTMRPTVTFSELQRDKVAAKEIWQ
jgi:hypothetical protein